MVLEGIFPPDERVEKEALSLIESDFEVTILCPDPNISDSSTEIFRGVRIWRVPSSKFMLKKASAACLTLPFYFKYWRKQVKNALKKDVFDIIHVHDLPLAGPIQKIAKEHSIPVVLDFHENYPDMLAVETRSQTLLGKILIPISKWRNYEISVLDNATHVVSVVEEMKNRLEKINSRPEYIVVDNTLKVDLWPSPEISSPGKEEDIKLVFVGGLTPKRGLDIAIEGVSIYNKNYGNHRECYLDIYGGGKPEYLNILKSKIEGLNLRRKVNLKGFIKLPESGKVLGSYTAAIIPNIRSIQTDYSSPNKLYQYLYNGLPILSSNCDSLKRFIEENDAGIIYDYQSPAEFAKMLNEMVDRHDFIEMKKRVHRLVAEKFHWDITVQNLVNLYKKLEVRS